MTDIINKTHAHPTTPPQFPQPFYRSRNFWLIFSLFLGAFCLRILLANVIQGHPTDIRNFKLWSMHLAQHPFREFYESAGSGKGIWADYPPLYMLVLWFTGKFYLLFDASFSHWTGPLFTLITKLPAILADLGCMAFLIVILKRYVSFSLACFAGLVFALHPAVFYESAMWGQIDSVTLFLQLAGIWLLIRKDYAAAILVTALNILVKPQGLILMPLILALTLYRRQWMHLVAGLVSSAMVTAVLTALFVPLRQIPGWLWEQYVSQANLYAHSSIQAFNLWSLSGMWQSDVTRGIFGWGNGSPAWFLQHKTWGLILFSLAYAAALVYFWLKDRQHVASDDEENGVLIWHVSAFIMVAFFLFPTRMHERYLFSGLFLLLGSAILQKRLIWPFWLFSATFMLNLLYELPGDKKDLKFSDLFYNINALLAGKTEAFNQFPLFKLFAIFNLLLFAWVVYILWTHPLKEPSQRLQTWIKHCLHAFRFERKDSLQAWIPAPGALDRKDVWALGAILFATALLKLWRLEFPPEMVFDEVYHARAAGEYILGIKPLEWVHPPLAKLLVAVGVLFYDLTGVGWRVMPVIAGTLLLVPMYCLGRFLFPYRWQAVAATIMLACDGVYFIQSRMAMTNIFATLFQVSALALTWRFYQCFWHCRGQKRNYVYFLSAVIFIALALSTRWTSLWSYAFMIMVLGFGVLVPSTLDLRALSQRKVRWTLSFGVLQMWIWIPLLTVLIPFVIYLIAYTPYYLNYDYDLAKVLKEQVGIWNYHSNLKDPHPYYSSWYTWPWLARPTWYYFQNHGNGTMSGILAVGNPAIWWFSMPVVLLTLVLAGLKQRMSFLFVGLACLAMYLPWGLSPRTLNYAHYFFEAVPYACLSVVALMGFLSDAFGKWGRAISIGYFSLVCVLFCFFFPIYSALHIPWFYYNLLRWFPSWV